ncbi:MAG: hypothetical protein QNJ12_04605 [Ilumatobacter sp.]|uniref:tetratricopeptide repeat protein n=1 Tax=Ilumatobacter sp. TaxID=1967498 RepID=UPI002611BC13|nr:site-2 protease family protein [Ilumatobacter sp.]MDJ0768047.1 hypothetical protein [Ilumatobacter sp.]
MIAARSRTWLATVLLVLIGVLAGLLVNGGTSSGDLGEIVSGPIRFVIVLVPAAVVLTSLHESAHAIVGRLVGWQVFGVTIGHGRRLASMHLGSVRLELRGTLVGGVTIANATGRRWRDVAMLAAGITVESVVIAATLPWDPGSAWGHHAKWAIVLVACVDIAFNLWPRRIDVGPVSGMATDGAQLLSVLTSPDQWRHDLEQMRLTPGRARLVQTLHGGDMDEAIELARVEAAADPGDDRSATLLGTLLLMAGQWREAFDQLVPVAVASDAGADPMLANNIAWAAVMTFDPGLVAHADRYSERAFAERLTEPACASTRGSTLVLLGRADEGLPLLKLAAAGRISRRQRAYVLAFTALAEHRLGRFADAGKHLSLSETLDASCPALPEIKRLMLDTPVAGRSVTPAAWPPPQPADRLGGG